MADTKSIGSLMNKLICAMEISQIHPNSITATRQWPIPNVSVMAVTKSIGYLMNKYISAMEIGKLPSISIADTKMYRLFDEQAYLGNGNWLDSSNFHYRN